MGITVKSLVTNLAGRFLGLWNCLVVGFWSNSGPQYGFHLVESELKPMRTVLDTPMVFMPQLQRWTCLDKPAILVAYSIQG